LSTQPAGTAPVLDYLRTLSDGASPGSRPGSQADSVPVDLGVGAEILATPEGLHAVGFLIPAAARRLGDLLGTGSPGVTAPLTYLADHHAAREAHGRGYDPILYRAYRDVLPPRDTRTGPDEAHPASPEPRGTRWRADLVVYCDGTLPGEEPFRSTGHWNTPGQVEIFQALTGQTLLITARPADGGKPVIRSQVCGAGDIAVVPPGGWHLTYCISGPAAVFNIYTDLPAPVSAARRSRRDAEHNGELKYCAMPPPKIAARRTASGLCFTGDAALAASAQEADPLPGRVRQLLPPETLLSWSFLHAPDTALAAIGEDAREGVAGPAGRDDG
jgi:oxalate decarboxylase/phosphoglucose isomerase-like protein (cupin superfamily)